MTPEQIESRLKTAYPGCDLVVIDTNGQQDHYDVRISSTLLVGSRIQKHQAIMKLFAAEFKSGELHAMQIQII